MLAPVRRQGRLAVLARRHVVLVLPPDLGRKEQVVTSNYQILRQNELYSEVWRLFSQISTDVQGGAA